jgi:transcriptional regulator GlxA family with amidase domain
MRAEPLAPAAGLSVIWVEAPLPLKVILLAGIRPEFPETGVMETFAAAVSMSGRHFERLFKRETGQSPLRYYRHLRLAKARQRVLYSDESLTDIAASIGYARTAPMARHYQELFGVSPKDERRLASGLSRAVPVAAE